MTTDNAGAGSSRSASPTSSTYAAESDSPIVVLYASETGNTHDAADRLGREFRRWGRRCVVQSMDEFDIFELPSTPHLLLLTSTHGRGDPPSAMLPLWTLLLRSSLPPDILEDVHFSIFGLGDTSYDRFCYAGKMLLRRMEALGAHKVAEEGWGDERAPDGTEQAFRPWLRNVVEVFKGLVPGPQEALWEEWEVPPPLYRLESLSGGAIAEGLEADLHGLAVSPARSNGYHTTAPLRREDHLNPKQNGSAVWKPPNWGWAKLVKIERVTAEDWWQDVRQIELEVHDAELQNYAPGSICDLQPQSSPSEVSEFLSLTGLDSVADAPYLLRSASPDQTVPSHLPPPRSPTTLRSLLTNHLDLRSPPRQSMFEWLRRFTPDERERERLDDFLGDPDEIHTYATRPKRSIVETLADFRETKLPLSHLLEVLPPLTRRQFSIASASAAHPGKIQLLVALVEYKTNLSVPRQGLCTSWLKSLPPGTRIPIHISPPTLALPRDPSTPVVLVGPGTGVAPMRAFLETRIRQGPAAAENTVLYFGCRSRSADLYYGAEWAEARKQGASVEVAFSRDGETKEYVQHLIRRDKMRIYKWVVEHRGHLYICGSSNAMPREVREAVAWCISKAGAGDLDPEEATAYVERMFEDGRAGEESW